MTLAERFRAARRDPTRAVLEGFHPLKHAYRFGATLEEVVVAPGAEAISLASELAPEREEVLRAATVLAPDRFAELAPHPPATGVLALSSRPKTDATALLAESGPAPVVLLENPTRLGNLGATVRVAAAAEAAGVVALGDHDPWSPEAIRGAAGLQFALPVVRAEALPGSPRPLVALAPDGRRLGTTPLPSGAILAFGGERHGLSESLLERASIRISIPMRAGVSSLNLATSVAICLYAWRLAGPPGLLHRRGETG